MSFRKTLIRIQQGVFEFLEVKGLVNVDQVRLHPEIKGELDSRKYYQQQHWWC
jgi:hypothetical protein